MKMFFDFSASNNSRKDANNFAPSCSCAFKNSYIAVLTGIAIAVSVFLSIIRIDVSAIIIVLNILLIIGKELKRKKQLVG